MLPSYILLYPATSLTLLLYSEERLWKGACGKTRMPFACCCTTYLVSMVTGWLSDVRQYMKVSGRVTDSGEEEEQAASQGGGQCLF